MMGILVDVTRCSGCSRCIDACVLEHALGEDLPRAQHVGDGLSATRWSSIVLGTNGRFIRKFCRHCMEPACVSVCPVGAMYKTGLGPVLYDAEKCMGCRYCMMACPYGIPRYEWDSAAPRIQKCTMCYERLKEGRMPACVEACPENALMAGEREDLILIARSRLKHEPQKYLPKIYGEHEAGGASVLYISDVPLGELNYHGEPDGQPLPDLSWNWISKVPTVSAATTGLMVGLFWIIGRRMQVEEARNSRSDG